MRRSLALLLLLTPLAAMPRVARGQTHTLEVRVSAIAGATVYVDGGADDGLTAGDTLTVVPPETPSGRLVVVETTAETASLTFVGLPFPITRGDRLRLTWTPRPEEPADSEPRSPRAPPSLLGTTRGASGPAPRPAPRLAGRVTVGSAGLWSFTEASGTARTFATPHVGVRASATNLPGGLRAHVDARATYRHAAVSPFTDPLDLRVYRAAIESHRGPVHVEAGRFLDPFDRFTGVLDGARLHLGSSERGLGLALGMEPDLLTAAPSTERLRGAVSAHATQPLGGGRLDARGVVGQVRPRADALRARTYGGGQLGLVAPGWHLSAEALLDRDPATGRAAFSRLYGRLGAEVSSGFWVSARAARRRSYVLTPAFQRLGEPSDQLSVGASYAGAALRGGFVSADVTRAASSGLPARWTGTGSVRVPRLPGLGVGLRAFGSAGRWRGGTVLTAGSDVTRSFGRLHGSLGYRYAQTPLPNRALVTHGFDASLHVPITRRGAVLLRTSGDLGGGTRVLHVSSSLWWRL